MLREMCKSKLHAATVTETHLNYTGSLTVDEALMEQADILAGERVQIVNINTGARFDTYVIRGERGSGVIGLNGAAARGAGRPRHRHLLLPHRQCGSQGLAPDGAAVGRAQPGQAGAA